MIESDKKQFLESLNSCAVVYRTEVSTALVKIYWDLLKEYATEEVQGAIFAHMKTAKFFPSPAELIEKIPSAKRFSHIGADEAWTIALASFDENATVVWTKPIQEARAIASEIYATGDTIGARMAFKEAYKRIVDQTPKAEWTVCAGWDARQRLAAVKAAQQLGRLPGDYRINQNLLPVPEAETTAFALLEKLSDHIDRSEEDVKTAKEKISRIKSMLSGDLFSQGIEEREKQRQAFELHRQNELARIAAKSGELH